MGISYSTIQYSEVDGSPDENWTFNGLTATVKLLTPWYLRYALTCDILSNRRLYPWIPGSMATAREATITPFGPGIPNADKMSFDYELALVTFKYIYDSHKPEGKDGRGEIASISLEPTAEFLTVDPTDFHWGSSTGDTLLENEAPGKIVRGIDLVYTQFEVSAIPIAILALPSCCNNTPLAIPVIGLTFAAETLLYQPPGIEKRITVDQKEKWKLTHRLSFKPTGWNKFWRAKTQQYEEMYYKGSSTPYKNYPPASFDPVVAVSQQT